MNLKKWLSLSALTLTLTSFQTEYKSIESKAGLRSLETSKCDNKYIVFASEDKDSKEVLKETKILQDFEHLEASIVETCEITLDDLIEKGDIEMYVLYNKFTPEKRDHPQYLDIIDDDLNPPPKLTENWAYDITEYQALKEDKITGKGLKVGILDTGIDSSIKLFNLKGFHDFVNNETEAYDEGMCHGTYVSSIIQKVLPEASLYVYKIHNSLGENNLTDILGALNQSMKDKVNVINNSWGLTEVNETQGATWVGANSVLAEALERVSKSGILIEASSGNSSYYGTPTLDWLPEGSPYVISTGATDINGEIANFSDLDSHIYAPGHNVFGLSCGGVKFMGSGTSFSGPYVTAAMGVIDQYGISKGHNFSRDEVLKILQESAINQSSWVVLNEKKIINQQFKTLNYRSLIKYLKKNY